MNEQLEKKKKKKSQEKHISWLLFPQKNNTENEHPSEVLQSYTKQIRISLNCGWKQIFSFLVKYTTVLSKYQ